MKWKILKKILKPGETVFGQTVVNDERPARRRHIEPARTDAVSAAGAAGAAGAAAADHFGGVLQVWYVVQVNVVVVERVLLLLLALLTLRLLAEHVAQNELLLQRQILRRRRRRRRVVAVRVGVW